MIRIIFDLGGFEISTFFGNQIICSKKNCVWSIYFITSLELIKASPKNHGNIFETNLIVMGNVFFSI